ncbi:hypothetical protein LOTGIDRAFT_164887 [Lottia gigantea]|uniref:Uncharacterized protein n=1 Tax=Lottia gigantea TaxID=225164 RepID=V4A3N9_LOTGI|nr:hypothetical protein LOTGIDRAFT_164887 [Lottia gigantea]ESO89590.1 hypothetical protein LOTGIDRAFT_164887 [Lottia gigantea]
MAFPASGSCFTGLVSGQWHSLLKDPVYWIGQWPMALPAKGSCFNGLDSGQWHHLVEDPVYWIGQWPLAFPAKRILFNGLFSGQWHSLLKDPVYWIGLVEEDIELNMSVFHAYSSSRDYMLFSTGIHHKCLNLLPRLSAQRDNEMESHI